MKIETNLIKIQPDHPVFRHEPVKNLLNKETHLNKNRL